MPFSRNLRFSHTMATDSSDQFNLNPTTTTKENPKQTLDDDDSITTAVTPTKSPRKRRRRGRTNRWGFRSAFYNRRRFRCEVRRGFEAFVRRQERYDLHRDRNRERRWGQRHEERNIERKIYCPSTLVNFFKIWLWNVTFIWVFLLDRFRFDLFLFQVFKTQNDWEFKGIQR